MIVGYTADPNCLMWLAAVSGCGGKTRPKTRPLEDKTKAVGALLKYPSRLHSFFTLFYSSLLYSFLPTSTLFLALLKNMVPM